MVDLSSSLCNKLPEGRGAPLLRTFHINLDIERCDLTSQAYQAWRFHHLGSNGRVRIGQNLMGICLHVHVCVACMRTWLYMYMEIIIYIIYIYNYIYTPTYDTHDMPRSRSVLIWDTLTSPFEAHFACADGLTFFSPHFSALSTQSKKSPS